MRFSTLMLALTIALPTANSQAEISESTFHRILELAERVYAGDFLARNLRLQLHRQWQRDEKRASASQQEDRHGAIAIVSVTGGIARDPNITRDAFALIVCHEIGHHLAGPPHRRGFSAEGQADYFAASECLRRLLPLIPNYAATAMEPIPRQLESDCDRAHASSDGAYLCLRIAVAGAALSRYFATRRGIQEPRFSTSDPRTVTRTRFLSASPQCRLDTFRAAALCNPSSNHNQAPHQRWLCTDRNQHRAALRPLCWYRG